MQSEDTFSGTHAADAQESSQEATERTEKVAELVEKQARNMEHISILQRLLSLEESKQEGVTLPCDTLPVAENQKFYGREDVMGQIDDHLKPEDTTSRLSSIALYGLGGIGKTQIALAYAYKKIKELDAVFWIPSEDTHSIQQGFTRIALDALKLPKATPQAYHENMILVLDWLQKTTAKWLIIFDNVDRHDVLDGCWPVSKHGAILVTTRDVLVASLPIDRGLEVNEFDSTEGAEFLLRMSSSRKRIDGELQVAKLVATELGGLPLALNQMAALINAKNCSIDMFQTMYTKRQQQLHKEKRSGWKYLGYEHSLDTVWDISFANLGPDAQACLGVLSYLSADSVPSEVFTTTFPERLPEILNFCADEWTLEGALKELTHHALVRKNIEKGTFRIHRLVQAEYRSRMENAQEKFDAAVTLLLAKLPAQRENKYDDEEWILYERYIPQVLSLVKNYLNSESKPKPLKPSIHFVNLLVNASNAIHDNDTMNVVGEMLGTANSAFHKCPPETQDQLLWAFLQSLNCMYHLSISEFKQAEGEMSEGLEIRLKLLPHDDLLIALAYSWLSMAIAAQGRYEEGLDLLLKAGKVLEGPAGEVPTRKLVWRYNTARNYYCLNKFSEAEDLMRESLTDTELMESWYMQVYAHLTCASLRTRMDELDEAEDHCNIAKQILETSGVVARFSWLSSYCAYRAGDVAYRQGRFANAIQELERAMAIGKLVKVHRGVLARYLHAYSKALSTDPLRAEEAERQRLAARQVRSEMAGGGGDLDDESDEAFDMLVTMHFR